MTSISSGHGYLKINFPNSYFIRDILNCFCFSQDGRRLLVGSEDKTLSLWDWKQKSKVAILRGHTKGVSSVAFSNDGSKILSGRVLETMILSGGADCEVREWNARTAKMLAVWKRHEATVTSVAYSYDGRWIVTGSTDSMILILDSKTKDELCAFACKGRVTCIDIFKNSFKIAAGDGSGSMYLLEPTFINKQT